jgi:hypothetical protein
MGNWVNKSLTPTVAPDSENHPALEDIARLAEGSVRKNERDQLIHHINRCPGCYEILQQTLQDLSLAEPEQTVRHPWWKTQKVYALAAAILLIFIISGQLGLKYWYRHPQVITAALDLDRKLKDVLLEDNALRWEKGARLSRLETVLREKGLAVKELNSAVLAKPYYQKKSLFGPKEVLHIRIEQGVAYLEVKENNR